MMGNQAVVKMRTRGAMQKSNLGVMLKHWIVKIDCFNHKMAILRDLSAAANQAPAR
ncbi:hypothetical protein [Chitinibacter sp. GC72]|uniref:hypothetical protein n=1 Tax=Chitinibacter sp. GC72 TaxID=1526917 RepID=UPI0012F7220D|nr:hypothetical protein [Chitinibacter sp. GC72]